MPEPIIDERDPLKKIEGFKITPDKESIPYGVVNRLADIFLGDRKIGEIEVGSDGYTKLLFTLDRRMFTVRDMYFMVTRLPNQDRAQLVATK